MLFSTMTFVFMFLPIVLVLYLVTKKELHNPILLISSIIFYAWGEPKYLAIMLLTILINYYGALFIEYAREKSFNDYPQLFPQEISMAKQNGIFADKQ